MDIVIKESIMHKLFFVLMLGGISSICNASDEIKLMAYDIPSILQKDKQGEYDLLIAKVKALKKQNWKYEIAPPGRVDQMFESKLIDCILPYDKAFYYNKNTLNSAPLNKATARIYTLDKKLVKLSDLKGKRVGARTGMIYGPLFNAANLDLHYVSRIEQNIDKLLSKRIDAFVAWSPDVEAILQSKKVSLIRSEPFIIHNEAFLCHDTAKARVFIKVFNDGLAKAQSEKQ